MGTINISRSAFRTLMEVGGSCAAADRNFPMSEYVRITTKGARVRMESSGQVASIKSYADAETVTGDMSFCVSARDMSECVKVIGDTMLTIEADTDRHTVKIVHKDGSMVLPCVDAAEFPDFVAGGGDEKSVTLPTAVVTSWLKHAKPFISTDELRPVMCGIRIASENGMLTACASDGHLLFYDECADSVPEDGFAVIVPNAAIPLIMRLIAGTESFAMKSDGRMAWVSANGATASIRLVEGRYPNFRSVIPSSYSSSATVSMSDLKGAMDRIRLTAPASSGLARFAFGQELHITAEDADFSKKAEEVVSCTGDADMAIGFSCKYLDKALSAIDGDNVTFMLNSPDKAAVLAETAEGSRKIALVMPMVLG